ncbi:translation initiation factor IF-2, mitochondrial-like [Gigantopelta aegis]|uniref:translation initiation factor IF-2, mitochondrial-like n=1 Tax=Gigantopelta aegis TaxID=1735272 RepID=UPI001B889DB5|nr:translation initiation factor IF-2, mitochondrial-like [Gigantopelta aegis]XP_041353565.1 translation initiation factor IF-2, mitochondrial-like [Gigantopelta aegis]
MNISCPVVCRVNWKLYRLITGHCMKNVLNKTAGIQDASINSSLCALPARRQCLLCQSRSIHTDTSLYAAKARNTRKKLIRPVRVNIKPIKQEVITIHPSMTVIELAEAMNRDTDHVFDVLAYIEGGIKYDKDNSVIDNMKVIQEVVKKSGFRSKLGQRTSGVKVKENKDIVKQPPPDPAVLTRRPPIVTIMGHVDHGKTTLLDALRKSNVVAQEFGGITQHIGAFMVKLKTGEGITFLDTPGHAAFSAMRARGAQVTDIVVLVVAAEDGVMNQTVESISHAKTAEVPVIVAINKIDKPEADIERTKQMLLEHQLILEDFGGDVQAVPISALKGTNLLELEEAIVTQAEVMELKADAVGLVEGTVIESSTDSGRGKLATVVIRRGTLKKGFCLVAGTAWGKVRGMFDDNGHPIQEAPPSTPVEIIGWKDLPSAGDEVLQVESESIAREVTTWRKDQQAMKKVEEDQVMIDEKRAEHDHVYREELIKRRAAGRKRPPRTQKQKEIIITHEGPQLALILKGDVDGSVEAILDTLDSFHSKKCRLDLIHYGVGNITESDVELAKAFNGEIFGFNVQASDPVSKSAASKQVPIRLHKVIYKLFDELKASLSSRLPVLKEEETIGEARVQQVFTITEGTKKVPVAGCRCTRGVLYKKKHFKVLRGEEVVYDGPVSSLKHFKNEVDSIKTDVECGISLEDRGMKFKVGDIIRCYDMQEVTQDIDWEPGF